MNHPCLGSIKREDLARKISAVDGIDLVEARRQIDQFMAPAMAAPSLRAVDKGKMDGSVMTPAVNPLPDAEGCPA